MESLRESFEPSIFVCLKNSRRDLHGAARRRSNGGASAKMLFERQSGLVARPAGCYIIHIYTGRAAWAPPRLVYTGATCHGTAPHPLVLYL